MVAKLRLASTIWGNAPDDPEGFDATDERIMCSAAIDAGALPKHNGGAS